MGGKRVEWGEGRGVLWLRGVRWKMRIGGWEWGDAWVGVYEAVREI